jgi:DNA helicase HerA-like ATPase
MYSIDPDLEIGSIFEVSGSSLKIALDKNITELSRSHDGRMYDVGQIGSIIKFHLGRKILFATVRLLRLQTDEEAIAIESTHASSASSLDRRVIEADLLGEATWNHANKKLRFKRGVSTYPLPLQNVYLITKDETEKLFESAEQDRENGIDKFVKIGNFVGATKVSCRANIDKLFGQHTAVLGSTGYVKSGTVASIIHSVLASIKSEGSPPKPRIILLDPHGEYEAAFKGNAKVFRAYDSFGDGHEDDTLALPYWLMTGDEFRSLIIGKTEFEATSQANTVYKALTHARMFAAGLVKSASGPVPEGLGQDTHPQEPMVADDGEPDDVAKRKSLIASFDRDRPVPFSLEEFESHIRNRQAKRWQGSSWSDKTPGDFQKEYSSILDKLRVLKNDPRIKFLMQEHTSESPSLKDIVWQFVGVEEKLPSLKIIDLSGLHNEVAGPLTGALARLLFQYKLHQTREQREADPVLLICEEAHRYVPNRGEAEYAVAQTAIRRIAREGRKYGLGLMLVSQRPADVEGTVISQCNSWIVLRLSNSSDQEHVSRFLPDSLAGLSKILSSLPRQEALFVGEAAALPARIRISSLSEDQLPNSNDISYAKGWCSDPLDQATIGGVADRMQGNLLAG